MARAASEAGTRPYRILVVEDEYFIADDLVQALAAVGAEVVGPLPDPAAALDLILSGTSIDIAILDINLQDRDVYPLADTLVERDIPFVFAAGYDRSAVPEAYRDVPRWEKPYNPHELARAVPGIVEKHASRAPSGIAATADRREPDGAPTEGGARTNG